jgi:isopentenyl-diphosphate delta-isomerase
VDAGVAAGWGDLHLLHQALPAGDLDGVDLRAEFLGHALGAPLVIAAMTGGHAAAKKVNAVLAQAAGRHGLAMGLGSQRAALRDARLAGSYRVAREAAPEAFLIANIGAAQLVRQTGEPPLSADELRAVVRLVNANALAIHFNFLQETVQPEGDRRAAGLREAFSAAVRAVDVPVIGKETGAGFSRPAALELRDLGARALDVGGVGGTSFAAIEGIRARAQRNRRGSALGAMLRDWGVPTAVSIVAAAASGLPIIATGGVRNGLDAAKAIALGASLVGVARPLLTAALQGTEAVDAWITQFLDELRAVMFLSGCAGVQDLQRVPRVVLGDTRRWLDDLGYAPPD